MRFTYPPDAMPDVAGMWYSTGYITNDFLWWMCVPLVNSSTYTTVWTEVESCE